MEESPAVADGTSRTSRRRLPLLLGGVAIVVVALDQAAKYLAVRDLTPDVPQTVIDVAAAAPDP